MQMEKVTPSVTARRAIAAVLVFVALACVLLFAASVLVSRELLPQDIGKAYVIAALVAASFISTGVLARGMKTGKAAAAAVNFALAEAVILVTGLVIGRGELNTELTAVSALSIIAGSITGCITSAAPKRKR